VASISDKKSTQFVQWIPDRMMTSVCSVAPPYKFANMCGTSLFNSTAIASTFERLLGNFKIMFKKKAYVYQYTQEGMTEDEFHEAASSLEDLISQY
jgi:tubulin beta